MMRSERPPSDRDVRERVARDVDVPTVLEAGAGSGKTTVIVDRLVEIVVSGRAPISRIAAITFTRAAASSLRLRLRERLEELGAGGLHAGRETTTEQRALAAAALDGLDGAPISTIHSFCLRLLAERPVEAGIEPGSGMLDEHGQAELLRSSWRAFLLELEADPLRRAELLALRAAGLAEPSWAADEDDDRLFAAAVAIARNRDLPPFADPARADLAPAAEQFRRLRDELRACLGCCIDSEKGALDTWRDNLTALETLAGPDDAVRRRAVGAWADKPPLASRRGQKGAYRPAETLARMRELIDEAKAALEEAARALRAELHGRVVRLLAGDEGPSFLRTYARLKREAAALDFQDLLLGARRLLADPDGPRRDLAERYPYLLIDEFQDTDPVQVEIAQLLAGPPGTRTAAPEAAGTLFVVGDPRQSIYRFRRADLASYVRFARNLERRGGRRERLAVGFRSSPGLLRWLNGAFAALFGGAEDGDAPHVSPYAPIAPHRDETPGPCVHVLPLPEGAGGTAEEDATLEARLLANLLHGWFRDAPPLAVEDRGTPRPCRPGDVMVVVRRTARLDIFREAFARRGIPASFEGGRGFFGRGEVQALLAGLRSVLDPADDASVASALRSVLVGAADPAIAEWVLAGRPRGGKTAGTDAEEPLARAVARFARLHELAQAAAPGEVVRETLASFRLPDSLRLMRDGESRANNVEKVAALAADFAEPGLDSLRAFVREFERRVETNAAEPDLTLDDPADVVQVTTIHRAKGLERPVVVLADARAFEAGGVDLVPQRDPGGGAPGSLLVAVGKLVPAAAGTRRSSANGGSRPRRRCGCSTSLARAPATTSSSSRPGRRRLRARSSRPCCRTCPSRPGRDGARSTARRSRCSTRSLWTRPSPPRSRRSPSGTFPRKAAAHGPRPRRSRR
jgi:ATP-dependent helicase/nuclease subunit A